VAIESRMIVGGAAALAVAGGVLWLSAALLGSEATSEGRVEAQQAQDSTWALRVKDPTAKDIQKTAAR
jgi:hypothetical protein